MPLVTTVIDDKSPLISYDAGWRPGSSTLDDPLASKYALSLALCSNMVSHFIDSYYLGTHTVNNVTDCSLTFNFNGTAVWLYGAKRTSHGSYIVQLDSQTFSNLNGEGNNSFQQSLFNTSVDQGMHTVKLINTATGGLFLDIDMVSYASSYTIKCPMSHRSCGDQRLAVQTTNWSLKQFKTQIPAFSTKKPPGPRLLAIATSTSTYLITALASEQLQLDCCPELIILI